MTVRLKPATPQISMPVEFPSTLTSINAVSAVMARQFLHSSFTVCRLRFGAKITDQFQLAIAISCPIDSVAKVEFVRVQIQDFDPEAPEKSRNTNSYDDRYHFGILTPN